MSVATLTNSRSLERATDGSSLSHVPRLPKRESSSLDNSDFTMPSSNTKQHTLPSTETRLDAVLQETNLAPRQVDQ